jgi:glyoxylase-like metal-dependent hydrolase (beta-lactamase superfamily II)
MSTPKLKIRTLELGPYATNCYIVWCEGLSDCWIIDASFDAHEIVDSVRELKLTPIALILTHAHIDHIAGVETVRSAFPGIPLWNHEHEQAWLGDPELNLSAFSGMPITCGAAQRVLHEGDEIALAGTRWKVLHVPGHSPGSIALHCAGASVVIAGDALFAGSIGRTDFPGCSFEQLEKSIKSKLYTLPDDTRVLPGHGPSTTIGREKKSNQFVRA